MIVYAAVQVCDWYLLDSILIVYTRHGSRYRPVPCGEIKVTASTSSNTITSWQQFSSIPSTRTAIHGQEIQLNSTLGMSPPLRKSAYIVVSLQRDLEAKDGWRPRTNRWRRRRINNESKPWSTYQRTRTRTRASCCRCRWSTTWRWR